MKTVILLSSFHSDFGKCNYLELFHLIEYFQPEVIFEELSDQTFSAIYNEGCAPISIEAKAIKKYAEKYELKHFSVDTFKLDFFDLFNSYDIIANRNPEYLKLFNKKLSLIKEFGHSFLNSSKCDEMLNEILQIEEIALGEINDEKLTHSYNKERQVHNMRETEMIHNIYKYSEKLDYENALFICGVEHRNPIIEKIKNFEQTTSEKLNWVFYEP